MWADTLRHVLSPPLELFSAWEGRFCFFFFEGVVGVASRAPSLPCARQHSEMEREQPVNCVAFLDAMTVRKAKRVTTQHVFAIAASVFLVALVETVVMRRSWFASGDTRSLLLSPSVDPRIRCVLSARWQECDAWRGHGGVRVWR